MKTKPFPYQLQAIQRIEELNGVALVGLDLGLGKSAISLWWWRRHPEIKTAVVVCPASLKWNWQREAALHISAPCEILEGRKVPRDWTTREHGLVVLNYDILAHWLPALLEIKPQLVILDEGQYLGNRTAKRTRASKKLCRRAKHVLVLSGTPLTNRPSELYPILNILQPMEFPSFFPFAMRYCAPKKKFYGWDFSGASHLKELHKRLISSCMIRMRKSEVLTQLPPIARHVVPLDIQDRKEYDKALGDFRSWMVEHAADKLSGALKSEALVQVGYLKRLTAKLKMKSVLSWVDSFLDNTEEKLILFCVHRSIAAMLQEHYDNQSVIVTGAVTGRKRQYAFDEFRNNRKCRLLIGNIRAAGTGWSAKGCSQNAFVEFDWVPGVHLQAEGRGHGIGRGVEGQRSESWWLVGQDTIEEKIVKLIQKKQKNITKVLDGGRGETLSVFDEFLRVMGREE